jgi:hypothetical protein
MIYDIISCYCGAVDATRNTTRLHQCVLAVLAVGGKSSRASVRLPGPPSTYRVEGNGSTRLLVIIS